MPLLMCPNDNSSMQTMQRNGVEFDMCPTCRGVWLDRGELEKLMEGARASFGAQEPQAPLAQHGGQNRERGGGERGEHGERGEYGERGEQGHDQRRRRRGFDLFDIFD